MEQFIIKFTKSVNLDDIPNILEKKLENTKFLYCKSSTEDYRELVSKLENVFVISKNDKKKSCLFFNETEHCNEYKLVNIVPKNGEISDKEYIKIVNEISSNTNNIKKIKFVTIDNANDLNKIIHSEKARKQLQFLIKTFPNSYHPNDIKRIDEFICYVHSFSRNEINLANLKEYLISYENLDKQYVCFLISRIKTGLQVLSLYSGRKYIY